MNNIEQVKEFHQAFQQPVFNADSEPTKERKLLRLKLALEELCELAEAMGLSTSFGVMLAETSSKMFDINDSEDTRVYNKAEVLDALCDIEYINNGTIVEFGLDEKYLGAFRAVHLSNMSKLCTSETEALETVENYRKQGVETYCVEVGTNLFAVKRFSDNKILKSINYKPFNPKLFI